MPWVDTERHALVATLRSADPDGSTLCDGWTTRHLLAHLVQRDQDLFGSITDMVSHREPGSEKHLSKLVDRARSPQGFDNLVSRFLRGAPRWSPMSWAAETLSLLEFVIHHEDIRRGGPSPMEPRVLPDGQLEALWQRLPTATRLGYRRSPVGVTLATPQGPSVVAKNGTEGVLLTGDPVELALYVSGRRRAASVDVSGTPEAVARFEAWLSTT